MRQKKLLAKALREVSSPQFGKPQFRRLFRDYSAALNEAEKEARAASQYCGVPAKQTHQENAAAARKRAESVRNDMAEAISRLGRQEAEKITAWLQDFDAKQSERATRLSIFSGTGKRPALAGIALVLLGIYGFLSSSATFELQVLYPVVFGVGAFLAFLGVRRWQSVVAAANLVKLRGIKEIFADGFLKSEAQEGKGAAEKT